MRYTSEILIDRPINEVIALFDNPENMSKWQPELTSFEHISGEPGQVGAKSRLHYQMGKRQVEMIETITERNLPHSFAGTYVASGVKNHVHNQFVPVGDGQTRWIIENEFKFSGMMAILSLFMRGAFRKQTDKYLQNFKNFAEGEETV